MDSAYCIHVLLSTRFNIFFLVTVLVDFLSVNSVSVHCLRTHKFHFSETFSLKMGPTALFTHLKINLLQYFQFSVFSFNKINSIQTVLKLCCNYQPKKKEHRHFEIFCVSLFNMSSETPTCMFMLCVRGKSYLKFDIISKYLDNYYLF